jgi:protein-tyrosine-phosphatase
MTAHNPVLIQFKVPESNVFLMTRFRDTPHHSAISAAVADGIAAFGLELVRADNPNWTAPTLWERVECCLEACHFGVAIFESIDQQDFNPNVFLELGYLMALKRQCLLLKEQRLRGLPADLGGHLYKSFDSMDIRTTILGQVADWLKEVGVRKRDGEVVIVFVSNGGTCRCALAKAVTRSLLHPDKEWAEVRVESRAIGNPPQATAAKTAIRVAERALKQDWLSDHSPRRAGSGFLYEADLILATDRRVLDRLRNASDNYPGTEEDKALVRDEIRSKSHLLTEFFGGSGDVEDPWPDKKDKASSRRYEARVKEIQELISGHLSTLTDWLQRRPSNSAMKRQVAFGSRRLSA